MGETEMLALVQRFEDATEGNRDLDFEFLWAIFPEERKQTFDGVRHISTMTGADGEPWYLPLSDRDDCPRYSISIDEVLPVIRLDRGVTLHRFFGKKGRSWATVFSNYPEGTPRPAGTLARPEWTCSANTEALALCAAALKARMEP